MDLNGYNIVAMICYSSIIHLLSSRIKSYLSTAKPTSKRFVLPFWFIGSYVTHKANKPITLVLLKTGGDKLQA